MRSTRSIPSLLAHVREARGALSRTRGAGRRRARNVAVDAVFDSVSVATTLQGRSWRSTGIIFCSMSARPCTKHPEKQCSKYLGTVVPQSTTNFFAALNSAVFSRRLVRLHPQAECAARWSSATYFRINAARERPVRARTLLDRRRRRLCQLSRRLHRAAARRKPACMPPWSSCDRAARTPQIKYSTVQNWYPGDKAGQERHLQFRHQARRLPRRPRQDLVDAGRDRLGDHLEIPRKRILEGDELGRRVLFGGDHQQPPAGRYRHQDDPSRQAHLVDDHLAGHLGRAQPARSRYPRTWCGCSRGPRAPATTPSATPAADRRPLRQPHRALYRGAQRHFALRVEHEATTSKISEDQMFYCRQRSSRAKRTPSR